MATLAVDSPIKTVARQNLYATCMRTLGVGEAGGLQDLPPSKTRGGEVLPANLVCRRATNGTEKQVLFG